MFLTKKPFIPKDVHAIAVRCPNWIGDAVMATPVFALLRKIFPHARITAVADQPIATLLEGLRDVDEWLVFSRSKEQKWQEQKRITRELAARHFDLGILLTRSFSSAWMFARAKIRTRIGFSDHFRRLLLNIPVPLPKAHQHDVTTYLELLKPLGPLPSDPPKLSLAVRPLEIDRMKTILKAYGWTPNHRLVVLNPGAAYGSAKCWPKEYFHEVVDRLSKDRNIFCVFIGDAKAAPLVDEICSLRRHTMPDTVISLAGETSLRDLIALISLADCVVTNDSGPMHIAAALHRPLVALFGSTDPHRTGPFGNGKVLYTHVSCSPCFLRSCPKQFQCMRSILPHEVIHTVFAILRGDL